MLNVVPFDVLKPHLQNPKRSEALWTSGPLDLKAGLRAAAGVFNADKKMNRSLESIETVDGIMKSAAPVHSIFLVRKVQLEFSVSVQGQSSDKNITFKDHDTDSFRGGFSVAGDTKDVPTFGAISENCFCLSTEIRGGPSKPESFEIDGRIQFIPAIMVQDLYMEVDYRISLE